MAGVQPVAVDPVVYRLVREAVLVSRSRAGFNAAIGPLVQLWRIGFEDAQIPERTAIQHAQGAGDPIHDWKSAGARSAARAFDDLIGRVADVSARDLADELTTREGR